MAECIKCDVAIVGSGFAGALIANELAQKGISVVVLEAGPGVTPNINDYMKRFYTAPVKVPESAYPPELFGDPNKLAAGRPTSVTLDAGNWKDPKQSYLVQKGPRPFTSTYERLAGGTSHWLGTSLRLVPNDFRMKTNYGKNEKDFSMPDWPAKISSETMRPFYERAEAELGVSADAKEQSFLGISFSKPYPMPRIPPSLLDQRIGEALTQLTDEETKFLGMEKPVTQIAVRSLPAARNSQPYRNRRACAGNTNCIPICPIQAKYDPTITLNEATDRGAQLIDHAVANEIVVEKGPTGPVTQINFITYKSETGPKAGEGCVKARIYVIAANAIETPRLLLMSKNQGRTGNGAANTSDMVGRNLMDHPYYVAWGLLPMTARPVFPYRGPLITSGIGDLCDGPFRAKRAAFRVDIGNEGWNFVVAGAQFGGDPHVTTIDFVNGMNASGLNKRDFSQLKDNIALFGAPLAQKLNDLISRQFRIGFLVEQTPDPKNRVTLSSEFKDGLGLPRPEIAYDLSDYTRQGIVASYRMRKLIFDKLGATDFTHPLPPAPDPSANSPGRFQETIDGKPVTLTYGGAGHIMGTYRMGDNPKTSVVDSFQRSHDHNNLYLVGSGTFPTGGTANPTLTLSALAIRTADRIAGDLRSQG